MKALLNKKVALLLLTAFALAFSLSAIATDGPAGPAGPAVADEALYSYDEVFDACEAAFDHSMQVAQCVANVCNFYGCE